MRGPLPDAVRSAVEDALRSLGAPARIVHATPVAGGCINNGLRVDVETGAAYFLKWNAEAPLGMFDREADGLGALAAAGTLRVPAALSWGDGDDGAAWLLLEHVPQVPAARDTDRRLGIGLAHLHARAGHAKFGWAHDNWIGSLPQRNDESGSWGAFWRDRRLAPQLELARRHGHVRERAFDRLLEVVPAALGDVTSPGLVHGDLWSGNVFATAGGEPVVVDPAVYAGHGEVDLAMSELFGGFGPGFYDAYDDALGIPAAYRAYRRDLYQLYYLLVHVNLFGASYAAPSLRAAERVLAALR